MSSKTLLNYFGQLRLYSFLDLVIFATALTSNLNSILGISFLWLSFLFYLESRHNDELRLKVHNHLWLIPFGISLFLIPVWVCVGFALFSYLYTEKKKNKFFGITAPLWRALQNAIIAFGFKPQIALLVFVLIFIRNLIADFRDVHDDKQRNIQTIPVLLGLMKNQPWAFYVHIFLVIGNTLVWFHYSFLDIRFLLPIIILQLISYPLTPRLSNPRHLDIYNL